MAERLLTIKESAARLGLAEITLRTWVAARKVAAVRLGRALRVSEGEVERLIERGRQPAIERRHRR